MSNTYIVRIYNPLGTNTKIVTDFISLTASAVVNNVGTAELVLPDSYWPFLAIDGIIEIERAPAGYAGKLLFETRYFIRYLNKGYAPDGTKVIKVSGYNAMHLLKRRIVAYAAGNTKASYSAVAADDALKNLVSQNLGSGATDSNRNISSVLAVQASTTLAPTISKDFAWQDLFSVMQDIVQQSFQAGTYLAFDVVAVSGSPLSFEFRTYIGQRGNDRRAPSTKSILLDVHLGNLSEAYVEYDYREEANYIYALGQGENSQRTTAYSQNSTRISASPAGRIEGQRDARNLVNATSLQAESDSELRDRRGRKLFNGRISETPTTAYDVTFSFGDYLTATLDNESFDVMLEGVVITVNSNGNENIEAIVKSPVS